MSKALISDQFWALMTEGQKVDAVVSGHATLQQMSEGLLDGSEQLRHACREVLADTGPSFENLPADLEPPGQPTESNSHLQNAAAPRLIKTKTRTGQSTHPGKQKFGLPDGFEPRLQRYGRSVLLELNVYRLPNGLEFIASRPTGTLGASRHLYALLTSAQYLKRRRGSVYVRSDGRIFDYSVDSLIPLGDLFDTGYTISDLERTGAYAPELRRARRSRPKKQRQPTRVKRAAAAG
jgi:hypothetical protein